MYIKKLSIEHFGSLLHFDIDMNPKLAIIENRNTVEICTALGILLNIKTMPKYPALWVSEKTKIYSEIIMNNIEYHIYVIPNKKTCVLKLSAYNPECENLTTVYLDELSYCFEEDMMTCFSGRINTYSDYFSQYLNEENSNYTKPLSKLTEGYSNTQTFRAYLLSYIKNYKSELIRDNKPYKISISRSGRFFVTDSENFDNLSDVLSESEKKIFSYLCFLSIYEFWNGFEIIRNMHYDGKPMIVKDFLEYIDNSIDMQIYFNRAVKLEKQVIYLKP